MRTSLDSPQRGSMIVVAYAGSGCMDLNKAKTRGNIIDKKLALAGRQAGIDAARVVQGQPGRLVDSLSQRAFRGEL